MQITGGCIDYSRHGEVIFFIHHPESLEESILDKIAEQAGVYISEGFTEISLVADFIIGVYAILFDKPAQNK